MLQMHIIRICCREEVEAEDGLPFGYMAKGAQLSKEYVIAMKRQKSGIGWAEEASLGSRSALHAFGHLSHREADIDVMIWGVSPRDMHGQVTAYRSSVSARKQTSCLNACLRIHWLKH
ncbi:unnamed protein product [Microthlaspi erraticum]|uniref:Uncharacterized protein n=1 Tax=Microthlaspi erraticum TaxID=1685480 RepID=A0A6D2INB8_9BRAS|nr:unnamed protein product [Microthlaspi erraticum]